MPTSCSRAAARNVSPAASSTERLRCLQPLGELADRRRLAGAVDARQHDDERALAEMVDFRFERPDEIGERGPQQRARIGVGACAAIACAQVVEQVRRSLRRRRRPVSNADSSSSSASSSSTRRRNAPVSAPDSFSRDTPRPAFSRSDHEFLDAGATPRLAVRAEAPGRRACRTLPSTAHHRQQRAPAPLRFPSACRPGMARRRAPQASTAGLRLKRSNTGRKREGAGRSEFRARG